MGISWIGAIVGLIIAIVLILYKTPVFYGMMAGAVMGGLIGFIIWTSMNPSGLEIGGKIVKNKWNQIFEVPIKAMIDGGKSIMPVILRILASGVLAGALIFTKAANSIANKIVKLLGSKFSLLGLIITALVLTASGVFIDVTIITIAPIALNVAKKAKLSRSAMLIALIGGGKVGNLISPNPNAIAASDAFHVSLIKVMSAGAIIAVVGIIVTYLITHFKNIKDLKTNNDIITEIEGTQSDSKLPSFALSILGPVVAIVILIIRPITNSVDAPIVIDPLLALPLGGFVTIIGLGFRKDTLKILNEGIKRMLPVAIMLAGTGMLSGIIKNSNLSESLVYSFNYMNLPTWLLAPFSGILLGFATASTTAGTTVASNSFAGAIGYGIGGAAMTHAGATVLDSFPHGSFFHSTAGAVKMSVKSRLKIVGWEALIGLSLTITSTIIFGVIGLSY